MKLWLRRTLASVAAAVAVAGGVVITSAPAAAAGTECAGKPSKRIGNTATFGTRYTQFGWAEWRWGTSGTCYQRKWVVVHVTSDHLWLNWEKEYDDRFLAYGWGCAWGLEVWDRNNTNWGGAKCWLDTAPPAKPSGGHENYHLKAGSWHSYGYYGLHKSLTSGILGYSSAGNPIVYNGGSHFND
jgi:hypothetical protein